MDKYVLNAKEKRIMQQQTKRPQQPKVKPQKTLLMLTLIKPQLMMMIIHILPKSQLSSINIQEYSLFN
jgi:hypothetical protein